MEKGTLRKAGRVVFFFTALGFLLWLLDRIGWDVIGNAFGNVGWTGAALLLFLGFLETFLDSASFREAQRGRIGVWRAMSYSGAGAIVNVVIPWEAGEAVKGTLLARHMSTSDAIRGTVIWNYLFKLTRPGVALAAAMCAFIFGYETDSPAAWMVPAACLASLVPFFVLKALLRFGMAGLTVRVLRFLHFLRRDGDAILNSAKELDARIRHFRTETPGHYKRVLLYQTLARIVAWSTWGVGLQLIGLDYSWGLASLIYAAISVSGYVVMLFPVRIGVTEGTGYLVFAMLGLDGGMGLVVAVIMRIKGLLSNGIPGLFAAFGGPGNTTTRAS